MLNALTHVLRKSRIMPRDHVRTPWTLLDRADPRGQRPGAGVGHLRPANTRVTTRRLGDAPPGASGQFGAALGRVVSAALAEDQAATDVTTLWTVPAASTAEARIICKQEGTLAGLGFVEEVFHQVDPTVHVQAIATDGDAARPGDVVAVIRGRSRSLLTGERTALNLLQRASGIATRTRLLLDELDGTGVVLRDTRKTAPGLRQLDKYAVRCGGGSNHRMGLNDMVLLKENHLRAAGGISAAVRAVRENLESEATHRLAIEVEVTTSSEAEEGLECGVDWLLLDNMSLTDMRRAVASRDERGSSSRLEASGNIDLVNISAVAATGVDAVAVGSVTHSAPALDFSMLIVSVDGSLLRSSSPST
jgi:nicotinate-nucleotide pyrophosphorylase (carboxylating)